MKTASIALLLATASLALAAPSNSAPNARAASHRFEIPLLSVLDANHDGALSAAEMAAAPGRLLALDLDDDGDLSSVEFRVTANSRPTSVNASFASTARIERPVPGFAMTYSLDANHDGVIQAMEILNATSSLARLDANHDGVLTADELGLRRSAASTISI